MNYLRSLNLLDLATELRLAEKRVRRFKESGEELKLERAKEYRDKLKKKINGRLESMDSSQDVE